jgi:hypothetical protein
VPGSPAPDGSGQGDFVAKLKKSLGPEGAAADIWIRASTAKALEFLEPSQLRGLA